MSTIDSLLTEVYGTSDFLVQSADEGKSKESYVVTIGDDKIFVKFDVHAETLAVLDELGIAPHLLKSGEFEGRNFIVQEFVEGFHPDTEWIKTHIDAIASQFSIFHHSQRLTSLLKTFQTDDFLTHVREELLGLEKIALSIPEESIRLARLEMIEQLRSRRITGDDPLVPVLGDPNFHNFIVSGEKIYIVDWDDIVLSDPLRDISLFLTNNDIPIELWPAPLSDRLPRYYWWLAFGQLNIALWYDLRKESEMAREYFSLANEALLASGV